MDFTQNYFELFGLSVKFEVDLDVVSRRYLELQKESHPDKFANVSAAEQRMAVQFSSYINGAHRALKSPLLRAEYLLELSGNPLDSDNITIKDGQFLFVQMEWRESLADLSDEINAGSIDAMAASDKLDGLSIVARKQRDELLTDFESKYNGSQFVAAQQSVAKLHFVEKMLAEIECLEDKLLD